MANTRNVSHHMYVIISYLVMCHDLKNIIKSLKFSKTFMFICIKPGAGVGTGAGV